MSPGAYWSTSRWSVATGVAITLVLSIPDSCGPSVTRRLALIPCACSAAHTAGAHPIIAAPLTWPAIQATASDCAAVRAGAGGFDGTGVFAGAERAEAL